MNEKGWSGGLTNRSERSGILHSEGSIARLCDYPGNGYRPPARPRPEGVSQKYLLRWALSSGPAICEAQAKISREMVRLLGNRRGRNLALLPPA